MNAFDPSVPMMRTIASICRCSSPAEHAQREAQQAYSSMRSQGEQHKKQVGALEAELARLRQQMRTDDYHIEQVERVGVHLVMQVRYPTCQHRAFDGLKTMVFLDVSEADALRWRSIDPHFRVDAADHKHAHPKDAPSPAARFPGTKEGWADALAYARGKGANR